MNYRIPISVLVYPVRQQENSWEFLLLRRTEERGGFWQGVSGHLEKKEKPIDAAKRELLEETSFIPNFIFELDYTYQFPIKNKDQYPPDIENHTEYVFFARINQDDFPSIDKNEHSEWKWCKYNEALSLLKWEENKIALKKVNNFLSEEN